MLDKRLKVSKEWNDKKPAEKVIFVLWIITQCLIVGIPFYYETLFNTNALWRTYLVSLCVLECFFALLILLEKRHKISGEVICLLQIICFCVLCVGQLEIALGILYDFSDIAAGLWNVLLVMFAVLFLSLLFLRMKWAMLILNIAVFLLGSVNHYFYLFRKQPLFLSDILLSGTAVTILGNYTYKIDAMFFCFLFIQSGIFLSLLLKGKGRDGRRLQSVFLVGCFGILLGKAGYKPAIYLWNISGTIRTSGYINTAVEMAKRDRKNDPPENYSPVLAREILEQYSGEEELKEQVNLIIIMNEAFADLPDIYGFETDIDAMPFIHSLEENTVEGNLYVSTYGGGTANTEYEFLTGNTMAFFKFGYTPYVQFVKKESPSLAWHLKDLGYQTIAFHPYEPNNYNRNIVYPFLGFDEFISLESELNYTDTIREYISDEADYQNIIDMYENRQMIGKPLFIFNVTMQNHGGYSTDESTVEVSVRPKDASLQRPELLEYLSLIKASDEAFEKLISYFSEREEKVVILIFGDHQPSFRQETCDILNENVERGSSPIKGNNLITHFVLWANYSIPSEKDVLISPGYLRGLLLDTAGVPLSNYDRFLAVLREKYAAVSYFGGYDNAGNAVSWGDMLKDEQIKQWQILQYENVFGKNWKN